MTRNLEIRPDIDQGIDRKELARLKGRFLQINQGRLNRAMLALSSRQQTVLKLLPLLLHVNHPLLPGYVSAQTPAGLAAYEPDANVLAEAQRLTRSFVYKTARGKPAMPIHALFLMGSLGSLAQDEQSDMDVWVCHDPDLPTNALAELQRKCSLLEAWAATQGAEAHLFLVDPRRFSQGERETKLTSDDCGTTQHYLLLDEFYRTALWLGGRTPLWWLVPAYEEHNYSHYTHQLLSKRFIREDEVLDLGNLAHIPPSEFIGAGLWQLLKGIESPYKSVLKLLLTEVYASQYPNLECLSLSFKQAVYDNRLDLDELDPYVVVYRRLEAYLLQRREHERLELIRRCLYLKANKKISLPPRNGQKSWQRLVLERLSHEWHWDTKQLSLLDSRQLWKVRQVSSERQALVNELSYSYRFLSQFARQQQTGNPLNSRDLGVLGRRLYAAFERKAGKVEFINPGIAPDLAEDVLTLAHSPIDDSPTADSWALYAGSLKAAEWAVHTPIKRSRELMELLAWCHLNGVIDSSSRLSLHPGDSDLSEFELFNVLGSLQQAFALPLPPVDEEAFLRPGANKDILLLINLGLDPLRQHSQMNLHMTTGHTDALGYAGVRENLVLTLDQISLNSWHELFTSRHDGPHALLDCLRDLLNSLTPDTALPTISVRCFCRNRAPAIAARVEALLHALLALHQRGQACRYLLQICQNYHVIELVPGKVRHHCIGPFDALLSYLGQAQNDDLPLHLDAQVLEQDPLRLILLQARSGQVQVFYRILAEQAQISILDERNALWQQRQSFRDVPSLLNPLRRFLRATLFRGETLLPLDGLTPPPTPPVSYHEVLPAGTGRALSIEPRPEPSSEPSQPFYNVQAILEPSEQGAAHVTLYCNQREFSALEYGGDLYAAVAGHILAQRRQAERYPCYLTDLDLSRVLGNGPVQTIHYLNYKQRLEQALNMALQHA